MPSTDTVDETNLTKTIKNLPAQPTIPREEKPAVYLLYAFCGKTKLQKAFSHVGNLESAIKRGRKHCEIMDYRFGLVERFLYDLDHQEELYTKNGQDEHRRQER